MLFVVAVLHYGLCLADQFFIEHRQQRRNVGRRILHKKDDPDAGKFGIVLDVEAVFSAFDQSHQNIGVARPDEAAVNHRRSAKSRHAFLGR